MKHKVKLMHVHEDTITLKVDGVLCSYLIQRPQPLSFADANMLRATMDTRLLESLVASSGFVSPSRRLTSIAWNFIKAFGGRKSELLLFGQAVADYIEKVGVEVDIDKETKGVVLLKTDVDRIRKGGIQ